MKNIILVMLVISVNALSQDSTGISEFSASREGHTARVVFVVGVFDPALHKIEGLDPCDDHMSVRVNGRFPLGGGYCNLPRYEIQSMTLLYDDRKIDIPKELYSDCYEPPFPISDSHISDYLAIRIGDDLKSAFVFMSGGDGSGSYQVVWVLRADGHHSRFSQVCWDCGFIDMKGFLPITNDRQALDKENE